MGSIQLTNDYILLNSEHIHLKTDMWDFPGSPGFKTPCFRYRRTCSPSWLGNQDHVCCMVCQNNSKERVESKSPFLKEARFPDVSNC